MTMVADGINYWPLPLVSSNGPINNTGAANAAIMDGTADRIGYVGRYYGANDSIASIKFRVGSIAASAGCGVQVRIETVVNGRPSTTLWAANTYADVVIADTDDNTFKTATLTAAASLVAGDEFAIVIIYLAGNDDGSFSVQFSMGAQIVQQAGHYPILLQDTGAGWVSAVTTSFADSFEWIVTMTTAGVIFLSGLTPMDGALTLTVLNNGSAADEWALRFKSPSKKRLIGMKVQMGNIATTGSFQFVLWDATGNEVGEELAQSLPCDTDFALSTALDGPVELYFTAPYTIDANTAYRAGVKSLSATNITVFFATVTAAGNMAGFPLPTPTEFYASSRSWDETQTPDLAGAWSDTTTSFPLISLVYDQIDDGTGAGGSGGGLRLVGHGGLTA